MMRKTLEVHFRLAGDGRDLALAQLSKLRLDYQNSDLDEPIKAARLVALNRKIDALRAISLNANAYPWSEDFQ